jgi:c-di-GMP-related signal transduction protein
MEVFVARQPILDTKEQLIGYELLYRNGQVDFYNHVDGDRATIDVLINSFVSIGVDHVAYQKKCFINFTENLLLQGFPENFPPEYVVVEILETIKPTKNVIDSIVKLKKLGYTIALDDFVYNDQYKDLVALADIIKVEFPRMSAEQHWKLLKIAKDYKIKLLAEKVETRQEFELAVKLGYDYFQGYFFSKPTIIKTTDIPTYSHVFAEIIQEINKADSDIDTITRLIERDLSLSYKLLKLINSGFQLKNKITSLKQAIVLLGLKEVQKWTSIISLSGAGVGIPFQAIELCLSRAKMGELLATHLNKDKSEFFLLGMFSLIDTILHRPMDEAVKVLPFSDELKEALLGSKNLYGESLALMQALENGDWETFSTSCEKLEISEEDSINCYSQAIEWSRYIVEVIQVA